MYLPALLLVGRCLCVDSTQSDSLVLTSALHGGARMPSAQGAGQGGQLPKPPGEVDAVVRSLKGIIASKIGNFDAAPVVQRLPNGNTKVTYSWQSGPSLQTWDFEVVAATDTVIPRNVPAAEIAQDFGAASLLKSLPKTSNRAIKIIAEPAVVEVHVTLDGTPGRTGAIVTRMFEDGRPYALQLNMSLPGANTLRESLLAVLAKGDYQAALVFNPFTPSGAVQTPVPVEIKIGRRIPVPLAQAVLAELSKIPTLSVVLSVLESDNDFLQYNRIYVGAMVKSNKSAMSAAELKGLLEPGMSQAELLTRIRTHR